VRPHHRNLGEGRGVVSAVGSWRSFIRQGRDEIADIIKENPSLAHYPARQLAEAYGRGRRAAADETRLADLPANCPWPIDQVLGDGFWPEAT
jgi:hypothetical protein